MPTTCFPACCRAAPLQLVILLGILALSALLLAALDTVRGWRKLPVFAVGGLCAWQCFYLVTVEQHPAWMFTSASRNVAMALAAVLAVPHRVVGSAQHSPRRNLLKGE